MTLALEEISTDWDYFSEHRHDDDARMHFAENFYVLNTCPPGWGEVLVASDATREIRARVDLKVPEITGKCLEMREYRRDVPSGERKIWSVNWIPADRPSNVHTRNY